MKMRRIILCSVIFVIVSAIFLHLWEEGVEAEAHYTPDYPMVELEPYLEKGELTAEEYTILFEQTGLGKPAIDTLWARGAQEELEKVQQNFFDAVSVECEHNTIISKEESLCREGQRHSVYIPVVEEGDILLTFNCHVFGWRVGHAGLVVNAQKRQTLEARVLGTDSALLSMSHWQEYPSFAVLRLKNAAKEEREQIAEKAVKRLQGVPYRLHAGIFGKKEGKEQKPEGTQCSHLVWCAFWNCGYDLDSDGGKVVTPKDIFDSPLLEVVQIYGMNPKH